MIRKKGGKYCLYSRESGRNLGCSRTKAGARQREREVQYFKSHPRRREVRVRQHRRRREVVPEVSDVLRKYEEIHGPVSDVEFDPDLDQLFKRHSNLYGRLSPEARERLRLVVAYPSDATWNDAYSIILRWEPIEGGGPGPTTLWQAVLAVDPTFPRRGPMHDMEGRIEPWPRIPDRQTLVNALWWAASAPPRKVEEETI